MHFVLKAVISIITFSHQQVDLLDERSIIIKITSGKAMKEYIKEQQLELSQHPFCLHLKNTSLSSPDLLAFVPHMTFFVLGFRDILETLRIENPQSDADRQLNQHIEEDSEHWQWFIQDLEKLDLSNSAFTGSLSDILSSIWKNDTFAVRNQVYQVIHRIQLCETTEEKLLVVECLEAAFAAFIDNFSVVIKALGLYTELTYFGQRHYEDEAGHQAGSWLDDDHHHAVDEAMTVDIARTPFMRETIQSIFEGFHRVFNVWQKALPETSYNLRTA